MIWVVSDHHHTRDALVPLLAAKGYQVAHIDCGDEVRKRIRFQSPVLVIIDCAFPDSFTALAMIRAEVKPAAIPIVMFSAGDEDLKEKALLKGADAFVAKGSLDWAELLEEVVRYAGPPPESKAT